jgi:hypothetical protein
MRWEYKAKIMKFCDGVKFGDKLYREFVDKVAELGGAGKVAAFLS